MQASPPLRDSLPNALLPPGRPQGSPPRSTPPPPLLCSAASRDPFVLIVRAGVVWSGVGTLAVALGGSAPLTISSLTQLGSRGPLGDRLSHVPSPLRGNLSSAEYRLHFQWRGLLNAPASSSLDDFSYV